MRVALIVKFIVLNLFIVKLYAEMPLKSFEEFSTDMKRTNPNGATGGSLEEFNAQINRIKKENPNIDFKLVFKDTDQDERRDCVRCPLHMKLTKSVNQILEKMARDPKGAEDHLPLKVSKLKMQFYSMKEVDPFSGTVKCNTFDSVLYAVTPEDRRMKGEAKFIAEEFFDISSFDNLLFNDPSKQKVIYYYRDDYYKDVLVQVVIEKNKPAVLRYYKYTPSSTEQQVIELPNLGSDEEDRASIRTVLAGAQDKKGDNNSPAIPLNDPNNPNSVTMNFSPHMIKHGILPRDYYIGDATLSREIAEGYVLSGESKLSLGKGNEASLNVKSKTGEVLAVKLSTKLNGQTEHSIVVPYALDLPIEKSKLAGSVQDDTHATTLSLSLVSTDSEVIRATARENKDTGKHSMVFSKSYNMGSEGVLSVSVGQDEASAKFLAARHAVSVNKSTSMAVDFKIDSERRTTLYYTLSTRF